MTELLVHPPTALDRHWEALHPYALSEDECTVTRGEFYATRATAPGTEGDE